MTRSQSKRHMWIVISSILIIFIAPMIVAWSLFSKKSHTLETLNYGHLIQPPVPLQHLTLRNETGQKIDLSYFGGGWLMLYVTPKQCDVWCQRNLYNMQQIRLGLGKDMNRVKRVVLTLSDEHDSNLQTLLTRDYLGTIHVIADREDLATFLNPLPSKKLCLEEGYFYLVDPRGFVMMSYLSDQKPRGIYRDLERLLKVSQIG